MAQVEREDWFPTPVWFLDHPEAAALNAALLPLIHAERAADPTGLGGKSSPLGWHSRDDLHARPAFAPLMEFVAGAIAEAVRFLGWDAARAVPAVGNCWAIVNGRLAANVVHTHPNAQLSGVYYVAAPEGCGRLFFADPRPAAVFAAPPVAPGRQNPWTFQQVTYAARPGRLILFPGWLPHGVEPNLGDGDRVCMSFNVLAVAPPPQEPEPTRDTNSSYLPPGPRGISST